MDPEKYLRSQGWKPGEGLRPGSMKRPLLVKHRKDNKGLGHNPMANEGWWERVFDGHLKSLDAFSDSKGVTFSKDEEKLRKAISPLYTMFRSGGVLQGTIERDHEPDADEEIENGDSRGESKSKSKDKKKEKKKSREDRKSKKIKSKKDASGGSEKADKTSKSKKRKADSESDSTRKGSSKERFRKKSRKSLHTD